MASSLGELQVSGCSQGCFKCNWTIRNFSSLDSQVGKPYHSPVFQLQETGMGWHLVIFPGGSEEKFQGYVSCYIYASGAEEGVEFKYRISLRNTDGEVFFSKNSCGWITLGILPTKGRGQQKMIKVSDLIPKLIEDSLVVTVVVDYCITYVENSTGIHRYAEITPMAQLADDMRKMRKNKKYSNCVISVEENDICVNYAVLCARSKVFSDMFKNTRRVEVTDLGKRTIESFLEYIYSGTVLEMDFDLALELLRASDKYEVRDLKSYCSNYLMSLLNQDNVCQVLVGADTYNAEKLREHALEYICRNISAEEFFEFRRSIFITRPNLLCDIVVKQQNLQCEK